MLLKELMICSNIHFVLAVANCYIAPESWLQKKHLAVIVTIINLSPMEKYLGLFFI